MKTTRTLALLLVVLLIAAAPAAAQSGAKALFYGTSGATVSSHAPAAGGVARGAKPPASSLATGFPTAPATADIAAASTAPTSGDYMGIQYWVELVGADGRTSRVAPGHTFRSGDRIRLFLRSNRDGYLTLVNLGSSGRTSVLFPNASTGSSNLVVANADYAVPPAGYIRFDDRPGEETLLVMLSPTPAGTPGAPPSAPPAAPPGATASAPYQPGQPDDVSRYLAYASSKGAKDLVVETDAAGPMPAAYAVAPASTLRDGGMISIQIKLRHH